MKIVFGTILLLIFILAAAVIAFTYVFAVNNNIDNMLKKKGFKSYRNYKKCMQNKSAYGSLHQDTKIQSDNYIAKYNYKIQQKEEKKQVEEYLQYEMSKRRK